MTITDDAGNVWIRTGLTAVIDGVFCRRWECASEIVFVGMPVSRCRDLACGENHEFCDECRALQRAHNCDSTARPLSVLDRDTLMAGAASELDELSSARTSAVMEGVPSSAEPESVKDNGTKIEIVSRAEPASLICIETETDGECSVAEAVSFSVSDTDMESDSDAEDVSSSDTVTATTGVDSMALHVSESVARVRRRMN